MRLPRSYFMKILQRQQQLASKAKCMSSSAAALLPCVIALLCCLAVLRSSGLVLGWPTHLRQYCCHHVEQPKADLVWLVQHLQQTNRHSSVKGSRS
jgi:hypothetical protein